MVLSKINNKISYPELKTINIKDFKLESNLYQMEILGIDIIVGFGNINKTFENENILFFPIYLVNNNEKVIQIGVFEFHSFDNVIDKNNHINIHHLNKPLLYHFVTREMLNKDRLVPEDSDYFESKENSEKDLEKDLEKGSEIEEKGVGKDLEKEEISDARKDIFELTKKEGSKGLQSLNVVPFKEENSTKAKDIREKYHESSSDNWLQKIMKNPNYFITDNEGGGDCLFATIRDAFASIGQQTTVNKLRTKLSEEVTDEIFQEYKNNYDMYKAMLITETNKIKELNAQYIALKEKFTNILDRNERKQFLEQAKEVKQEHDKLVQEKKILANIFDEVKIMKGIDTLDKFKSKIKKCEFWADTWAISTMERILNIKFIIFSSESKNDVKNIIQCGQLNDTVLEEKGEFNPDYYIMVEYTGNHYKTIGYNKRMIYKFSEIPYDVKIMIINKCLEKNAGPFAIIPDFQHFKSKVNNKLENNEKQIDNELNESKIRGLYTDDIVFLFYSKSNDKPLPGKGSGEKITNDKLKEFTVLANIPEWRKKLSNFWIQEFTLDNHKWASVEHYYQASKFKKDNPAFYLSFSLDSGTELSKDPLLAKAAGSKSGKLKSKLLRPVQVKIDPDFYGKRFKEVMYEAQFAKFTQNEDLKNLLLATKNAKLTHFIRGSPADVFDELMLVRNNIK